MTNNIWLHICCLFSFNCLPIQKSIRMTDGQQRTLPGFGSRWDEKQTSYVIFCSLLEKAWEERWMKMIPHQFSTVGLWPNNFHRGCAGFNCRINASAAFWCACMLPPISQISRYLWIWIKRLCFRTRLKSTHCMLKRTKDSPDDFSPFTVILETVDLIDYRGKESRC